MPSPQPGAIVRPIPSSADMLNKVPEVTLIFWIIKIMATTVGETGADFLAVHVGLGTTLTGAIMLCVLLAALFLQLRTRWYVPWIYWVTVVLVSIVGTQITDALTDQLDVSLYVSTAVFTVALAATFAVWYWSERTLSIHTIVTTSGSCFTGRPSCSPSHSAPRAGIWRLRRWALVSPSASWRSAG